MLFPKRGWTHSKNGLTRRGQIWRVCWAALKAFLAARAGDPARATQFLEEGNRSSAWGGPPAWKSLVTALTDVANATKLRNSGNLSDARLFQQAAQEKLRAAPAGGDVALLGRLVERALTDSNVA